MPVKKIPGTDKTYFSNPHTGDRVFNLSDYPDLDESLMNEDVLIIGNWSDYSGSGTVGPQEVQFQGISNEINDQLALAEEAQFDNVTSRGARISTHRQRPKLVHVEN